MITIGKIPGKLQNFFKPLKKQLSEHVYSYFWSMVLAICISNGSTIDRIVKALRGTTHRTNHGEFLWRSVWDESVVMQQIAVDMLLRLYTSKDRNLFFIIDDNQALKRAKKMDGVGKLHHHATGKYGMGHTIVKASLYYHGVTIPWGSWLYIKKEHAGKLKVPFRKLTETVGSVKRKLAQLGTVRIVFSRRKGENKHIAIVTDDMSASMKTIVANYLKRWSIEMLIKDEKQHLGLGDYRLKRYRAVVDPDMSGHLVDYAYACLTHAGIKSYRAQGQNDSRKVLRVEPISKLKDRMRRIVWRQNVQDVIKYSHEKKVIRRLEKLLAA